MHSSSDYSQKFFKRQLFSHIYVENSVKDITSTHRILKQHPDSKVIIINHYKDIFNPRRQDWSTQKSSPNLILASKTAPFLYKVDEGTIQTFNYQSMYYASSVINCIYDCDYCYLQGAYPSANILAFQNLHEFDLAISKQSQLDKIDAIALSYDSDMLALENKLHHLEQWIPIILKYPDIDFEIRTKSSTHSILESIPYAQNLILAWSLSPDEIIHKHELLTPKLEQRLNAILKMVSKGWKIRLCFDPVLFVPDFEETYRFFFNTVFSKIPEDSISSVYMDTFRMNTQYLKKMQTTGKISPVHYFPYITVNGLKQYPLDINQRIQQFCLSEIKKHIPDDKLFYSDFH